MVDWDIVVVVTSWVVSVVKLYLVKSGVVSVVELGVVVGLNT